MSVVGQEAEDDPPDGQPGGPLGLGAVGRDGGAAGVFGVVVDGCGVDEDRLARVARGVDDAPAQVRAAHALVVVLDGDDIGLGQRGGEGLDDPVDHIIGQRLARLEVHAEHLLRVAVLG